jgi:nitronate monooxygenase
MNNRFTERFGVELPLIQAPMAGASDGELAVAVSEAGGLGSLPCAMLNPEQVRTGWQAMRQHTARPLNLNFFCHRAPPGDAAREHQWQERLREYYEELGIDAAAAGATLTTRNPFDAAMCDVVVELKPQVVSFHFGLPDGRLLERVRSAGCRILSSATTVDEARWLEGEGCDAVIAQGFEAGGHRGMFLAADAANQIGTIALVPQVVDAVRVPVIAAGGIADARGIAAAFALGASAVQIGTAYLCCPESRASTIHRAAIASAKADATVLTNVITGRPARGLVNRLIREVGPMSAIAPQFPNAFTAVAPLRAKAEQLGSGDFSSLWAGQASGMCKEMPAGELTRRWMRETQELLSRVAAGWG